MTEKLSSYHAKRDFDATPEPRGHERRPGAALAFVVQKHAARRLHYDFRLELDGTLKSWAVPKGPSFDPHDKRLAVHVEDHPLDYADFEGTIPPGHYGAGTVIVWDRGEWIPHGDPRAGYRAGKLKFELRGEKLHGAWTLVRTRGRARDEQDQWLLIKEHDEAARPSNEYDVTLLMPDSVLAPRTGNGTSKRRRAERAASATVEPGQPRRPAGAVADFKALPGTRKAALPATLEPQLATLVPAVPASGEWHYEVKLDGYRILARLAKGKCRLITRNGHDWTSKLAPQRKALEALPLKEGWIDGELVVFDADGVPDFQALQNAFDEKGAQRMSLVVFDMPFAAGFDLRRTPLAIRREALRQLVDGHLSPVLRYSETIAEPPAKLLDAACRLKLEGLIGKRADAAYSSGRGRDWIKLKCTQRQEFVIGGFTEPRGTRVGIGALLLGIYERGRLRYAGRVGTGFDDRGLRQMRAKLEQCEVADSPFAEGKRPATASEQPHWVKPDLVAEVQFAEWTAEGLVRQAVFQGLRMDKSSTEVGRERPQAQGRAAAEDNRVHGIRISHADRVIDPTGGATKIDLARYYEMIAPYMLPHLRNRLVSMVRAPEGIGGELIFQKHMKTSSIPHLRVLDAALDPGHPPYVVIDGIEALVEAAQAGVVEFHTWNAVAASVEKPDRVVFDLDPDPDLPWKRVQEGAELTKALLDELELTSFLKTSGGKGLHIVVPLMRRYDWDTVKDFSQAVAQHLAWTLPDRFSAKMGAQNRRKKIFVDYLRNGRGASTIAAFSARTRPYLPVSVPLAWEELHTLQSASQWTIRNVLERLRGLAGDPWHDYEKNRQALTSAIRRLAKQREAVAG